jgi:cytochrome c oxidase subunit 3
MTHQVHAYHIVNLSPWPLTGALSALLITSGLAIWFHFNSTSLLILGLLTNSLTIYQWWWDIVREGTFQGHHTPVVQKGLWYGIVLFIVSEVFFFAGFFWAFYHSSLAPTRELGGCWPPTGINPLDPLDVPLLNTSVLLASGISITWAHHSLMEGNRKNTIQALSITTRHLLYPPTSLRIFWNLIHNLRRHLWFNLLHSNRISWPTCNYRLHIPISTPNSTTKIPFYIKTLISRPQPDTDILLM